MVKELWEKRRIVIRSIPKPRALRASFHAFNDEATWSALVADRTRRPAGLSPSRAPDRENSCHVRRKSWYNVGERSRKVKGVRRLWAPAGVEGGRTWVSTLSDSIERYLKGRLSRAVEGVIEIRRSEIAERFDCVPSQINYVLETRFTPQRGYYVESRRGGGGYIRIMRVYVRRSPTTWESICEEIGQRTTTQKAESIVGRLEELGWIDAAPGGIDPRSAQAGERRDPAAVG